MGNIISVLYILAFAGCGILTARPIFASDRPLKRILFGLTFGLVMLLWLPVLFAFILDFTLAAQILALAAAVLIAGVSTFFAVKKQKNGKIKYKAASKRDLVPLLVTIVPLVAVGWILHANHTITNASDGSLHVGQCTFGDLFCCLSCLCGSVFPGQQDCPVVLASCPRDDYGCGSVWEWRRLISHLYIF